MARRWRRSRIFEACAGAGPKLNASYASAKAAILTFAQGVSVSTPWSPPFGTPFTEKLQAVERYRLIDFEEAKDKRRYLEPFNVLVAILRRSVPEHLFPISAFTRAATDTSSRARRPTSSPRSTWVLEPVSSGS